MGSELDTKIERILAKVSGRPASLKDPDITVAILALLMGEIENKRITTLGQPNLIIPTAEVVAVDHDSIEHSPSEDDYFDAAVCTYLPKDPILRPPYDQREMASVLTDRFPDIRLRSSVITFLRQRSQLVHLKTQIHGHKCLELSLKLRSGGYLLSQVDARYEFAGPALDRYQLNVLYNSRTKHQHLAEPFIIAQKY